jgi:hypothetical protein
MGVSLKKLENTKRLRLLEYDSSLFVLSLETAHYKHEEESTTISPQILSHLWNLKLFPFQSVECSLF